MSPHPFVLWTCLSLASCAPHMAGANQIPHRSHQHAKSDLAGIPNVTVDYYLVAGRNAAEVRRSMDARRPYDPNVRRRVDALTTWSIDFAIPGGPDGCDLDRASVSYWARVQLPQLSSDASLTPAEMERWRAFVSWLEEHEAWHARHAWENVDEVLAAIRRSTCERAARDAAAAVQAIAREQLAFDQATREGRVPGIGFP